MLKKFSDGHKSRFSAYLKVDTGYHRAGIPVNEEGVNLAEAMIKCDYLVLKGLYSHW